MFCAQLEINVSCLMGFVRMLLMPIFYYLYYDSHGLCKKWTITEMNDELVDGDSLVNNSIYEVIQFYMFHSLFTASSSCMSPCKHIWKLYYFIEQVI